MPQLTITNHSELYPEVLNSLNKNASNEMSEYLHDKIRKHAMEQTRPHHSVFSRNSANFLSRGLFILPLALALAFKTVMLKLKEQLQIVSQLLLQ